MSIAWVRFIPEAPMVSRLNWKLRLNGFGMECRITRPRTRCIEVVIICRVIWNRIRRRSRREWSYLIEQLLTCETQTAWHANNHHLTSPRFSQSTSIAWFLLILITKFKLTIHYIQIKLRFHWFWFIAYTVVYDLVKVVLLFFKLLIFLLNLLLFLSLINSLIYI